MDHTRVDAKSVKSLEELQIHLGTSLISLKTLIEMQTRAIKAGIMPEDMNVRASNIIQQLAISYKMMQEQVYENKDLLTPDFEPEKVIKRLKKKEVENAREFLKKARVKE